MTILNLYAGIGGNRKLLGGNLNSIVIYSYICGQENIKVVRIAERLKLSIRGMVYAWGVTTSSVIELMKKAVYPKQSIAIIIEKKSANLTDNTIKENANCYSTCSVISVVSVGLMI